MKHNHSGSGRRFQHRGRERLNSTAPGGRPTSGPMGMASLAAQNPTGFASSITTGSHVDSRPQPGFAAAMARGNRSGPTEPTTRSRTWEAVVRTGKLKLRDGN